MTDETIGGDVTPSEALAAPETQAPAPEAQSEAPQMGAVERRLREAGLMGDEGDKPADKPGAAPKAEAESEGPARGPDGKFLSKEPVAPEAAQKPVEADKAAKPVEPAKPTEAAPVRFSADAKAEWEKTPPAVRAETQRAMRELETGIEKYRQTVEPLKPWLDYAAKNNQTLPEALERYRNVEQELIADPVKGLDTICRNMGFTLRDVAAQLTGQKPEETTARTENYIAQLQNKIAALEEQVGGVTKTIEGQREQGIRQQIDAFAAQPGRERFDELSDKIALFISKGVASDLAEAYDMADRLNPAPSRLPPPQTAPLAHTQKAHLSVQGAPSSGSNPAHRQRSASTSEALQRAFAATGLA